MTLPRIIALLSLLFAASFAFNASADNKALAETLFLEGKEMMKQGKFDEACKRFQASHQAEASVGALLNLARCHKEQGKLASAWSEFRAAAALADRMNQPERKQGALDYATEIEPLLSKLVINVEDPVEGLEVKRGHSVLPAGSYGLPMPVDPGTHVITASAPGYVTWTTEVTITREKQQAAVTVPALEVDESAPVAPGTPTAGWHPQETAGVIIASVGVASLIAGTVLGIVAVLKEDKLACKDDMLCTADEFADVEAIEPIAHASTATIAIGGAAFIAGGLLYLLAPSYETAEAPPVAVVPLVSPELGGIAVSGSF